MLDAGRQLYILMNTDKYPTKVAEHIYSTPAVFERTRFPYLLPIGDNLQKSSDSLGFPGHSPDYISPRMRCGPTAYLVRVK